MFAALSCTTFTANTATATATTTNTTKHMKNFMRLLGGAGYDTSCDRLYDTTQLN